MLAFELAFKYRNPVVILGDGYLGQMTGKVEPARPPWSKPGLPEWAVWGDETHRGNLICSIYLAEADLEAHNLHLEREVRGDDRGRAARRPVPLRRRRGRWSWPATRPRGWPRARSRRCAQQGVKAGLFRPITLWPFPIDALRAAARRGPSGSSWSRPSGQLEDELRLALSKAGLATTRRSSTCGAAAASCRSRRRSSSASAP